MSPPPRTRLAPPRVIAPIPLLLLLLLAGGAPAEARDRNTLWTVEGEHNTVYLLGSVHMLRAGDDGLPPAAEAAYEDAEQLVMEIDLDDATELGNVAGVLDSVQRLALLPAGQTLRRIMGEDYRDVAAHARDLGLDLALFDRFAPWFVGMTLLQLDLAQRGFRPELGIEQVLATRAAEDGKEIRGLETTEEQLAVLAGLPMEQQREFLLMTIEESATLDESVEALLTAWRRGDAGRLEDLLTAEYDRFPDLYRPLTEQRNRAWLDDLEDLLDDREDYLVVVGALHLVGRISVVDLLRRRGYRVEQQ